MSRVIPRSRSCLLLALLSLVAFGGEAARGQITFSPQEIVEGDIAFLDYRTDETVSHWTWDFGDGSSPESGPVDENDGIITQHQYGTLGDYVVTLTADDKRCSATLTVRRRGIPEFTGVKFGVSPRLAYLDQLTTTTLVTLSNASELEAPGRSDFLVKQLEWAILRADGAPAVSPSPTTTRPTLDVELDYGGIPLPPEGEVLDVTLTLYYEYKDSQGVRRTDGAATATQRGILTVAPYSGADGKTNLESAQKILSDGRFYKKEFPHELGWDDILEAYRAKGPAPRSDRYLYYHLLSGDAAAPGESARKGALELFLAVVMEQEGEESGSTSDQEETDAERGLAETVNEIVSGQLLVGNKRLIESLRVRYPRIADFEPNNPPERLPAPPEARQETAELEVPLLNLSAGLRSAFRAIRLFPKVLRTFDPYGPFAEYGFPQYITFEDGVLAQQPIPMLNEYAQVSRCLQRRGLGGVELGKKLFNLSINDPEARGDAKPVLKETAHEVFVGACILAAAQGAEGYKVNDGAQLRAEIQNARDLFQKINLGLNPLGNRGELIPNESFAAICQDAQESVADAREAEIEARQERRLLDQNQAALRNELHDQRASYITPPSKPRARSAR